ncbi:hypothetical protein [Chromobacterium phragmitis]|uniref:hypothetical protein n=1 Tax=Chromobacterium phragmitis TaxID=2202141 RepID=UPI003878362D
MLKWPLMGRPRRKAGFAAPAIRFDALVVRAALERLLDTCSTEFQAGDATLLLCSIPCEPSDRRLLSVEYRPFNFGGQSQMAADGPENAPIPDDAPSLAEWRMGGPNNEYRVGGYVLSHVPGVLRICSLEQQSRPAFRAELRYTPGTDQLVGLYRDIPHEFKLLHIRVTRFRAQLWKTPI